MLILLKFHNKVCSGKVRNENVNFTQLYIRDKVGTNKDHPDYHAGGIFPIGIPLIIVVGKDGI